MLRGAIELTNIFVPCVSITTPMIVLNVPSSTSEADFFCNNNPTNAIIPKNKGASLKISLIINITTFTLITPFYNLFH